MLEIITQINNFFGFELFKIQKDTLEIEIDKKWMKIRLPFISSSNPNGEHKYLVQGFDSHNDPESTLDFVLGTSREDVINKTDKKLIERGLRTYKDYPYIVTRDFSKYKKTKCPRLPL